MKLELYDYDSNKLLILRSSTKSDIQGECYEIQHDIDINGSKEMQFILPLYVNIDGFQEENHRWEYIQNELLVRYTDDEGTEDWYKIKSQEDIHDDNGKLSSNIQLKHISFNLNQRGLDKQFEITGDATSLLTKVLENTGWSIGEIDFFDKDGVEKIHTLKIDSKTNTMEQVQNVAELFEGFPRFNANKTIDLKKEIGSNNGVEFRYKKNLKNVSRTCDTESIITRLYSEGGNDDISLITISSFNPTKQNFIDNFSWYIESGIMPLSIQSKISQYDIDVTNINTNIISTQTSLNTETFTKNTKQTQLDIRNVEKNSLINLIAEIDERLKTETNVTIVAQLNTDKINANSRLNNLINGKSYSITGTASIESGKNVVTGIGTSFLTSLNNNDNIIIGGVTKTIIGIDSNTILRVDSNYTTSLSSQSINIQITGTVTLTNDIATHVSNIAGFNNTLTTYFDNKNTIESTYKADMGEFVHEGLFSDGNIISSEVLYNKSVETLKKLCYPKVSYKISILDLSRLTGYELEKFKIGDIISIKDNPLKLHTIGRITKMSSMLDDFTKTTIEIANFTSSFDNLFKEIAKSVDILQQKKEYWNRVQKTISSDGYFEKEILQKSFDKNLFTLMSGTNNSVTWDNTGITVADINSNRNDNGIYQKMVRINGGIIAITNDHGVSWDNAISSDGISFRFAVGGRLDVSNVNIFGGADNSSFFWNSTGLYAINPSNSEQWIRFNKDGMVFSLDNGQSYEMSMTWAGLSIGKQSVEGLETDLSTLSGSISTAQSTADSALSKANTSLQIDSFYNRVKISQANGIQVFDNQVTPVDRVKIGQLSPTNYGIQTKYANGNISQQTLDDGTIRTYDSNGNIIMDSNGLNNLELAGWGVVSGLQFEVRNPVYGFQYIYTTITVTNSGIKRIYLNNVTGLDINKKFMYFDGIRTQKNYVEGVGIDYVDVYYAIPNNIPSGTNLYFLGRNGTVDTNRYGSTCDIVFKSGAATLPNGKYIRINSDYTITGIDCKANAGDLDGFELRVFWLGSDGSIKYTSQGTSAGINEIHTNVFTIDLFYETLSNPRTQNIGSGTPDANAVILGYMIVGWGLGCQPPKVHMTYHYRDERPLKIERNTGDYNKTILATSNLSYGSTTLSTSYNNGFVILKSIPLGYGISNAIINIMGNDANGLWYKGNLNTKGGLIIARLIDSYNIGNMGTTAIEISPSSFPKLIQECDRNTDNLISNVALGTLYTFIKRAWLEIGFDKQTYLQLSFLVTNSESYNFQVLWQGW